MTDHILHRGRHLSLVDRDGWEFVTRHTADGVVAIVAVTDAAELVLVVQHRPALASDVVEIPAGLVGDARELRGEPLQVAAARELLEETGFEARHWQRVVDGPTSAGQSDEHVHLFLATGLTRVGAGGGDAHEDLSVEIVPLADLQEFLRHALSAGHRVDPKVWAAAWIAGAAWDGDPLVSPPGDGR